MNRRGLLQRLAGLGLLSGAGWLLQRQFFPAAPVYDEAAVWRGWIDHLIPADETPGAVDLGIDRQLWQTAAASPDILSVLQQGCAWLHQAAQQNYALSFPQLDDNQADSLINAAAQAPFTSLPHQFFRYTRLEAMKTYYADPRSRVATLWQQTPQPLGHMDYQQPCSHG